MRPAAVIVALRLASGGSVLGAPTQECTLGGVCDSDDIAGLLQLRHEQLAQRSSCSLQPIGETCSAKMDPAGGFAIQVLNSNIQAYKKDTYPDKFTCFGEEYVGANVDVMAFEEIDQDSELEDIFSGAGGTWQGAVCGVGKDSCAPAYDTGSGMGWNTAKFNSVPSEQPDTVLAAALPLAHNAWGVQISDADETGTAWGPQYRKLVYAVLKPVSQGSPIIFGAVHLGRKHGPNDPTGASQGANVGKVIRSAMEKNSIKAAIICGDWNPYWDEATKAFMQQFDKAQSSTRCFEEGCDDEIQCVGVGGEFSDVCKDPSPAWVADDHPVAAVQVQFTATIQGEAAMSTCPGSLNACESDYCCPGIPETGNATFPCPSASPTRSECGAQWAACPGTGNHCRGNQCCPGIPASNNMTFPCPIADPGYGLCEGSLQFPSRTSMSQ